MHQRESDSRTSAMVWSDSMHSAAVRAPGENIFPMSYMCKFPMCGRSFTDTLLLKDHIQVHIRAPNPERPHVCCECGKDWTQNNRRSMCEKKCRGETPTHVCEQAGCDYATWEKPNFTAHMATVHNVNKVEFACPVVDCKHTPFLSKTGRKHHMDTCHAESGPACVRCTFITCGYTGPTRKAMMQHVKRTHNG